MTHDVHPEDLVALSEGILAGQRQTVLEAHVAACADCRAFLSAHHRTQEFLLDGSEVEGEDLSEAIFAQLAEDQPTVDYLGTPDSELESDDLSREIESKTYKRSMWRQWLKVAVAGAALAASLVVVVQLGPEESAFREKAAAPAADAFVGFQPYFLEVDGARLLPDRIPAHSTLAFTYSNDRAAPQEPYQQLMIFAVDTARNVYWFCPAPGAGGESIAIAGGARNRELPNQVTYDLSPGELTIFALFSHRTLNTADVERSVAAGDVASLSSEETRLISRQYEVY